MIPRIQKQIIADKLKSNKLLFVQGPKRVGKIDLVFEVLNEGDISYKLYDCSVKKIKSQIEHESIAVDNLVKVVILKEAQFLTTLTSIIEDVLSSKFNFTLVICCSFKPKINDDLRAALFASGLEINVYAPSFYEMAQHFGLPEEERLLEERLIYGNYPEVLQDLEMAEVTLREIIQEAINTQLSASDRINKGDKLLRMLQTIAFKMGESISYNEIATRCDLDNETVERYIELFEDAFILYRLPAFFNEKKYELKKSNAIFFVDNGIRNVLINNFNPVFMRNDMNELWRNYVVAERIKWLKINQLDKQTFFWITHTKQRMDYIEVDNGEVNAYKMDWEKRKRVKFPKSFIEHYPSAKCSVINKSTYWKFLTHKK